MFRIIYFLKYWVGLCCMIVLLCVLLLLCCLVLYWSVVFILGLSWFVRLFSLMYALYGLVVAGNGELSAYKNLWKG